MSCRKSPAPRAPRASGVLRHGSTVAILSGAAAIGCSLGSFDYLSAEYQVQGAGGSGGIAASAGTAGAGATAAAAAAGGDAGSTSGAPAVESPCQARDDGAPCDDGDVCTPTSLCVSG